jgi:heterodisulfide reductase subunit B
LSERYFLFSGCLIPTRLSFLERSARLVLDELGIEYAPLPGATCCVEPIGLRTMGYDTWLAVTARMLAMAEAGGRDLLSLCNGCYMSLKESAHALRDQGTRETVNDILRPTGRSYDGGAEVRHFMEIVNGRGSDEVRKHIVAPQTRLRVAVHPGCHVLRPSAVCDVDRPFSPQVLSEIARWTGAEVVHNEDWPRCCGGGLTGVDDAISAGILNETVEGFRAAGANCILTPCPFCFVQFDLKQRQGMPVLYLSELLALSFGATPEQIGLKYHRNKLEL